MILKAFTNAISEATLALESAKDKVRSAGSDSKASKLFKSQVESQLPQPSSIKQQLTTQINNPDDLKEIERRFADTNKAYKLLDGWKCETDIIEDIKGVIDDWK